MGDGAKTSVHGAKKPDHLAAIIRQKLQLDRVSYRDVNNGESIGSVDTTAMVINRSTEAST